MPWAFTLWAFGPESHGPRHGPLGWNHVVISLYHETIVLKQLCHPPCFIPFCPVGGPFCHHSPSDECQGPRFAAFVTRRVTSTLSNRVPPAPAIDNPNLPSKESPARRTQCRNNLKQIGLAFHNYHDTHQCFPMGSMGVSYGTRAGVDEVRQFSWQVYLLPMLAQSTLYSSLDFSQPAVWLAYPEAANSNERLLATKKNCTMHILELFQAFVFLWVIR